MLLQKDKKIWTSWVLIGVFTISILFLAYVPKQSEFHLLIAPYALAFATYLIIFQRDKYEVIDIQRIGILIRILLIFSIPNLSDDVYRYIWDGQLSINGVNPYGLSPDQIMNLQSHEMDPELYHLLNSKPYKTVYPPLSQLIFLLTSWIPAATITGKVIVLKTILITFEVINVVLLPKVLAAFQLNPKNAVLYILNPLIILELSANVHLEGLMVSFMLIGLLSFRHNKYVLAALGWAASIAVKMLPLMLIPYIFLKWKGKTAYKFLGVLIITCLILFLPVIGSFTEGAMYQSLDLYFRNFEFNGSVYYAMRFLYFNLVGYNMIGLLGPLLAVVSGILILLLCMISVKKHKPSFFDTMLFSWTLYLLFATTVHPWYLTGIILFASLGKFRFPIVWSFLIYFSYMNYSFETYFEPWWSVFIQYFILITFILYELFILKRLSK